VNIFSLLQKAEKRLRTNDPLYHDQADTLLGVLRSFGILPYKRSSLNGSLHKLVAATIVEAFDADTTLDIGTRRSGTFHRYGFSTKIISYLDKMVSEGLLVSRTGKASGALVIGEVIDAYLDDAKHALV
jgi:hypothetical protein